MTKIEKLDELVSFNPEDWVPVQPSGQKTQKIKIGALAPKEHGHQIQDIERLQTVLDGKADSTTLADTVSVLEQADVNLQNQINNFSGFDYDQKSVPLFPSVGETWRERDDSNNLVNDWTWDGAKWVSINKEKLNFMGGSSTANSFFNFDMRFNYLFDYLVITFFCTSELSNTQWIRADLVIGRNRNPGNSQIGQGQAVYQGNFISGGANTTQTRFVVLNQFYSPQGDELIYCGFARLGTQNHWGTMTLGYRLVKK